MLFRSGKCFRIERRAYPVGPYMFLRQATEVSGKISFVFYLKVSDDPESQIIPVQSRDYTALAGHDNVPDSLGNPYPCTAKDLDFPVKRDTWLDKNETEMLKQRDMVGSAFAHTGTALIGTCINWQPRGETTDSWSGPWMTL